MNVYKRNLQRSFQQKFLPFLFTGLVIAADQAVKLIIVRNWPGDGIFIKDVFNNDFLWIIHVRNKAIAFSLGINLPESVRPVLFILLPLVFLGVLVWYFLKTEELNRLQRWALAGIIGGGLGNIIDRIFRPDGVVDYISVRFYGFLGLSRWPTFNIADSCVVVCGLLLLLSIIIAPKQSGEAGLNHE
jgi:signal peptidase II